MRMPSLATAFALYRARPAAFSALVLLGLTTSALEIAALAALYAVVSLAVAPNLAHDEAASRTVSAVLVRLPGSEPFPAVLGIYIVLDSLHFLAGYMWRVTSEATALEIRDSYHRRFFDAYAGAEYQVFLDRRAGDLKHWILFAPVQLGELAVGVPQLVTQSLTLAGVLALLFFVSIPITLGLAALSGALFIVYELIGRRRMYDFGTEKVRLRQTQSRLVAEALEGIKHFRVYGHVDRWVAAFEEATASYGALLRRIFSATAIPSHALAAGSVVAFGAAMLVLRWFAGPRFTGWLPALVLGFIAAQRLLPVAAGLVRSRAQVVENLAIGERAAQELVQPLPALSGSLTTAPLADGIRFDDVTLGYAGRDPVLHDVSFLCRTGTHTAIVGPSGVGKSSLLNLVVRLFEPTKGAVRIGDVDLRDVKVAAWRRRIGFVAQEAFLFHGTVAENIAFGREIPAEAIEDAARLAGIHDFIATLPDGYATVVGEQGLMLSGGQRQRVGVARAILTRPEVLVFDEATSSLDGPTEAAVLQAIAAVSRGRTVITVAHRLSSVIHADRIVVIDAGRVAEQGTHDELMRGRGVYFNLYRRDSGRKPSRALAG